MPMSASMIPQTAIRQANPLSAGLQGALVKSSGSLSDGSARTASDTSGMINQVQQIAAQNTAVSAQQAEQLRKWQELQNAKAMEFNMQEAAKNRDWQKMMSDTAHQREVADLKAAGLNPVLSAMGGQGASVTSGATASGVSSSGAQGEVDKSASQGLVSLLGTLMNTQTQLLSQAMSARSNEAIADKTNATSQLVAELTGQYGLQREQLSGEYGLQREKMSGEYGLQREKMSGEYGLAREHLSGKYGNERATISAKAGIRQAEIGAAASRAVQQMRNQQEVYMAQNYPNSLLGVAEALISAVSGKGPGETASGLFGSIVDKLFGSSRRGGGFGK